MAPIDDMPSVSEVNSTELTPEEKQKARAKATAEYNKAYREANREALLAKGRQYNHKNRDRISAKNKAARQDGTRILERERAYRKANLEKIRAREKARNEANREKRAADRRLAGTKFKDQWIEYKYGMTSADVQAMRASQGDCCLLCETPFLLSKAHIDHCHNSNVVRGLLCGLCNRSLGLMRDDPAIARSIIRYLKHHRDEAVQSSATPHPGNGTKGYFAAVDRFRKIQDGRCAICSDEFGNKRPHLDHCHKTGLIRSLLCHRCNMALGQINDNIEIAKNIIRYLKRHAAA
jgi:Recombination endonuclease VII